jgi:hypothetical protein
MNIQIIKDGNIYLTEEELYRFREEYKNAYMFYSGQPPTFESWVSAKKNSSKTYEYPKGFSVGWP